MQAARYLLVASRLNNDRAGNGGLEHCAHGYLEVKERETSNMLKHIQIRDILLVPGDAPGYPRGGPGDLPERMQGYWA